MVNEASASTSGGTTRSPVQAPSHSNPGRLTPVIATGPEFVDSTPPTEQQFNDKQNPICIIDGCSKVQQARTCTNRMCVDHCAETSVYNHRIHGAGLRICPSSAHQETADRRLKQGPATATTTSQ
ncbi:hypothetical protein FRC20_007714 [Serendipita sp. 405]|nr:hypothetical protein FRC20_007714 [Serendipita sp. 405]